MIYNIACTVLSTIKEQFSPVVESLLPIIYDLLGEDILQIFESFFTIENDNENYKLSLDTNKIFEFIASLETNTIEEIFNGLAGENAYSNLPKAIMDFVSLSFLNLFAHQLKHPHFQLHQ